MSDTWIHRSHGQKLRGLNEAQGQMQSEIKEIKDQVAQHDRDIKVIKSTVNDRSNQNL